MVGGEFKCNGWRRVCGLRLEPGGEFKYNGWRRVYGLRLEPGGEFKDVINIVLNNKHPYL